MIDKIIYTLFSFILSILLFKFYLSFSTKKNLFDVDDFGVANKKTPTGSGIIFLIIFFIGSIYFYLLDENFINSLPNRYYIIYFSLICFSVISFYDDFKPIDPKLRLALQLILIYFSTTTISLLNFSFPLKVMIFVIIIFWIYIVNITNFLDGLDGLLTCHSIFFLLSIILIKYYLNIEIFSFYLAILMLPILFGFLIFNKPIAKIYMGDTGSIFLGYLFGFMLLELISKKLFFLSFSIFIYPMLDCGITILNKMIRGYYPWARLFDYFFLAPVVKGNKSHLFVLKLTIIFCTINFLLIYFQLAYTKFFCIINFFVALCQLYVFHKYGKLGRQT